MLINARQDAALVVRQKYSCLQLLEQRTVVERLSAPLFVAHVRRLQAYSPGAAIVLDCRAREHVQSRTYLSTVQRFHAIVMAEHIPPYQKCSVETRDSIKKWLQINCNLKHVFAMDAYTAKVSLQGNNMLTRVLKYLGLCQAVPVRVYLLDCGLYELSKNKAAMSILKAPAPLCVGLVAKRELGDGLYFFPSEFLKSQQALEGAITDLNIRYVLNLTAIPTNLQGVRELGAVKLPLRSAQDCISYMTLAIDFLLAVPAGSNVIVIDTGSLKVGSEVFMIFLILQGMLTHEEASQIVRDRLNPPEFDSFAKAAFLLLAESRGAPKARLEVALSQYEGRYNPEHQLRTTVAPTMIERWHAVEELLTNRSSVQYTPIFALATKLFNNILMHPNEEKYRSIKLTHPTISKTFAPMPELGIAILESGGWERSADKVTCQFTGTLQQLRDILVHLNSFV